MWNEKKYVRHYEIDQEEFPVAVFESDDWGACELVPDPSVTGEYNQILKKYGKGNGWVQHGLERPFELRQLYDVLESHKGADGNPAVFTAFTAMGNPDFKAIRENGFQKYVDIPINKGFPEKWQGDGIINAMLEGMNRGIWCPEYHAILHHTSPRLWLDLLRSDSDSGKFARELFELNSYFQMVHLPEYEGYPLNEQYEFIREGFRRFKETFGRMPEAAVTSDAYPETEMLWMAMGISAVAIKNCRVNSGEVVVYPTKPWNMQDVYAKLGDCSSIADCTYLTRNVFCEFNNTAEEVLRVISRNRTALKEPSVVSSHRLSYCCFIDERRENNLKRLDEILTELDKQGYYYLTSAELASLYRRGWSKRQVGDRVLFRKWFPEAKVPAYAADLPKGNHWLPASAVTEEEKDYQLDRGGE